MSNYEIVREIVELLAVAKSCVKMQYSLSFSTAGERRARDAALRLIDLVSVKAMQISTHQTDPVGGGRSSQAGGGGMSGTPDKVEGI